VPIGGLFRHDFILFSRRLYGVVDTFDPIDSCTATRFACNKNDLGSIRKFVDHGLGEGSRPRNVIQTKEWDRFICSLDVSIETNDRDSRLEHIFNRRRQSPHIIGIQNDAVHTLALSLWLAARLSINFTTSLSFDPPPISCVMSPLLYNPQPCDGPVAITFEFEVDPLRGREFLRVMREPRLIHLRNGAFNWRLDVDLTPSTTYRIEMMVPSWTEYLLQRQRLTRAEQEIIKKVWCLHVGEQIPLERYYLCVNRELEAQQVAQSNASRTSTIRLNLTAQEVSRTS